MQSHKSHRFVPPPFPARSEYIRRGMPRTQALSSWGDRWALFSQAAIIFSFLLFGLAHFSFAMQSGPRDITGGEAPMAGVQSPQMSVNGALSWNDGVGRIQDMSSGKSYVLGNSDGVKALWDSGVRKVAVVGHVDMGGLFNVEEIVTP